MTLTKMKTCILITSILLVFVNEYSQGCPRNGIFGRRRRQVETLTAPQVNETLAQFFQKCEDLVHAAAGGIIDLPTAVEYVIRDSEWYKTVSTEVCTGRRDDLHCWIYAVKYLIAESSKFFVPTANCMSRWADNVSEGYHLHNELHCPLLQIENKTTPYSRKDNDISECIQSKSMSDKWKYPSLESFNATSVTKLLKDHYSYCRTVVNVPSDYKRLNLDDLLCEKTECPRTGPQSSWRTNIKTLYGVATRKDGPIAAAYLECGKSRVGCDSSQDCFPIYNSNFETMPCIREIDQIPFVTDKDECDNEGCSNCCVVRGECVIRRPTSQVSMNKNGATVTNDEKDELWKGAKKEVENTKTESETSEIGVLRSLTFLPPGLIQKCVPPVPFPGNCIPKRNEPYVLEAPINIPYCLRIPCNHLNNKVYEKSQRDCGMQPGCYFDKELFEYREAFGGSVLPGVPVCHLAIRNIFFQVKAREVINKYGSWNPYFTNCLLNEFNEEFSKGPNGCELLPILDAFYVTPKLAGWKNINSYECALIDGCWRKGRGCFYPVDIHSVRIKSGQRQALFGNKEITFGRPKCQHFDTSSPLNILKSYHRCLSAGCSVDPCVTYIYFNLLYDVGTVLTVDQHWNYWGDVEKGLVGAFNLERIIGEYGYYDSVKKPKRDKPTTTATPKTRPFTVPFDLPFPSRKRRSINVLPHVKPSHQPSCGYTPPPKVEPCGFAHQIYGARPCAPPVFRPPQSNSYCPYKPFSVPRFPTLKGRFDGCCDINLCYLSKLEISKMHSGPSHYYSEWSLFSECSVSCGGGFRNRSRKCISDDRSLCTERLEDIQPCNTQKCCSWSDWGYWSPCSSTCEPGIQWRTRECTPQKCFCPGNGEEVRNCPWTYCDG